MSQHQSGSSQLPYTMKVLALLSLAVCAVAADHGFAYSAYAPHTTPFAPNYMPYMTPYAYGYTAPAPLIAHAPAPMIAHTPAPMIAHAPATVVKTQYHMQNELGQASYGFSEPHHAQSVVQDAAGNRVGSFSFINADGKLVQTNYVADALGYRVESNDLPVAPMDLPAPVQDTPEVLEARAKFFKIFDETMAASRAAEAVATEALAAEETKEETEEIKSRARRSVIMQTPASTAPLTSAVVAPIATRTIMPHMTPLSYSPFAYSSAYPYASAIPYTTPFHYSAAPYSHAYPYYSGAFYSK